LSGYCSFAYSALASFSRGMSGSASFQRVRKILVGGERPDAARHRRRQPCEAFDCKALARATPRCADAPRLGGQAGVQAGADAAYVGLKGWIRGGARGEFDREELRLCIELAHALGKKVQLAANIIPKSQERHLLLHQLAELADWGLDAVTQCSHLFH